MKKLKSGKMCWCVYVNMASYYVSFKIEEGKFLGKVKSKAAKILGTEYYAVEHADDEVNYLKLEDIFDNEKDAYIYLINILQNKYGKN